jgi:hypothetical protein
MSEGWRKCLRVELSPPTKTWVATGFEDREGHRAPFTSVPSFYRSSNAMNARVSLKSLKTMSAPLSRS